LPDPSGAALHRGLSFLDRCYFDYSRRFVGHGLSVSLHLDSGELSQFHRRLREQYGERVESRVYAGTMKPKPTR